MDKSIFLLVLISFALIATVRSDPEEYDDDEAEQDNEQNQQNAVKDDEKDTKEDPAPGQREEAPGLYGAPHGSKYPTYLKPSPLKYGGAAYDGVDSGADFEQESIAKEFYAGAGHTYYRKPKGALAHNFAQYEGPLAHPHAHLGQNAGLGHLGGVSELLGSPVLTPFGKGYGPLHKPAAAPVPLLGGGNPDYDPLFAPLFSKHVNEALKVAHPIPAKSALFSPVKPLFSSPYQAGVLPPRVKAPLLPLVAGPLATKSYLSQVLLDRHHHHHRDHYNLRNHHHHHLDKALLSLEAAKAKAHRHSIDLELGLKSLEHQAQAHHNHKALLSLEAANAAKAHRHRIEQDLALRSLEHDAILSLEATKAAKAHRHRVEQELALEAAKAAKAHRHRIEQESALEAAKAHRHRIEQESALAAAKAAKAHRHRIEQDLTLKSLEHHAQAHLSDQHLHAHLADHHHSHHHAKPLFPLAVPKVPLDAYGYPAVPPKKVNLGIVSGIHSVSPSLSYGFSYKLVHDSLRHHGHHDHVQPHPPPGYYGYGSFDPIDKAVADSALKSVPAVIDGIHGNGHGVYGHGYGHGHHHHHHGAHLKLKSHVAHEGHYAGLGGYEDYHYPHHH